jgi:pimeloyl-ACP methyl ester carboxylesterase
MPPRRRRSSDLPVRRRWPLVLLFAAAIVAGVALWAYRPTLPSQTLIARYANEHSKFLDIAGARAHVRDEGNPDGIPIVMIHGSLESLQVWDGWVKALGDKYRMISVDLPGHGLTGAWPRDEYTIEAYTDFVEVLADELRLDRFVLVGHSMGGAVAWSFAATRPDRVAYLVLVDSSGFPRDGEAPPSLRLARTPWLGDLGIYFKPEMLARRALLEVYADPAMVTPELVKRYADLQRFPGNRAATLDRMRAQEPLDPTSLKRLSVPTLILWGVQDRWVPAADAFRFQDAIKGAKLALFEKAGHNPMEEEAAATAAAVAAFLPDSLPALPTPGTEQPVQPAVQPEKD